MNSKTSKKIVSGPRSSTVPRRRTSTTVGGLILRLPISRRMAGTLIHVVIVALLLPHLPWSERHPAPPVTVAERGVGSPAAAVPHLSVIRHEVMPD